MFRRIELIFPRQELTYQDGTVETWAASKRGLRPFVPVYAVVCGLPMEIWEARIQGLCPWRAIMETWIDKLRGPDRPIPRNAKFYFTERGWREIGRKVVAACKSVGQEYRIIRVKERDVNVVWCDRHYDTEVAAQPQKKKYRRSKGKGTS